MIYESLKFLPWWQRWIVRLLPERIQMRPDRPWIVYKEWRGRQYFSRYESGVEDGITAIWSRHEREQQKYPLLKNKAHLERCWEMRSPRC